MRALHVASTLLAAAIMLVPAAHAQRPGGAGARAGAQERRTEMRERLKAMSPEERKAAMDKAKERRESRRESQRESQREQLSPEQRAWARARATESRRVREGVAAGTLTRESAAEQLRAWRKANPRPGSGSGE